MTCLPLVPPPPHRVLLIKPSSLGDVVSALPVLRGLRRSFPQARVSWLLTPACAPLLAEDADLDEIVLFDRETLGRWWRSPSAARKLWAFRAALRRGGYDWVIDLQGLLRSALFGRFSRAPVRAGFAQPRERASQWLYTHPVATGAAHTVDRNIELARAMGIDARREDFTLRVGPAARQRAGDLMRQAGLTDREFLVLAAPTRWPTKQYPLRHWRQVIRQLKARCPLVLVGSPSERALCEQVADGFTPGVVNLAGRTSVADLAALLSRCAGVICSDSAAMFIAPAVGVEVLALIGPTQPRRTGPYGHGTVLVSPVACQGCLKRRCSHVTCMQLIDPSAVTAAARAMLERTHRP